VKVKATRFELWKDGTHMTVPDPLITTSPNKLGGTAVFAGTRVPVQALFDYLEAGDPLDEFLEDFPNVSKAHAIAVLALARAAAIAQAGKVAAE
jgi:uncharacterized protein (DUF433 family)